MNPYIAGNQLTLLHNGTEFFPALETAIDSASSQVYLESYIYADDATGQRIAAALMRAAQRGVETHLIIDGYGAQDYPASAIQALRAAGVDALIYRAQISPWRFRRQRLRRLHRKLAVIDQSVAFVGGINIVNDAVSRKRHPNLILRWRYKDRWSLRFCRRCVSCTRICCVSAYVCPTRDRVAPLYLQPARCARHSSSAPT